MFHATQQGDRDRDEHRIPGLGRILLKVPVPSTAHQRHLVSDGGSPGIGHSVWLPRQEGWLQRWSTSPSSLSGH